MPNVEKSNKSKTAMPGASRGNLFYAAPEDLYIEYDKSSPYYDRRVEEPLSENRIELMIKKGVWKNVVCRKDGERFHVVDGRSTVRHAIEANKRIKERGGDEIIKVPVTVRKVSDEELMEVATFLNEHRKDDGVLAKAERAKSLLERGRTEADLARLFDVTQVTITNWLKVLDLSAKVQAAVRRGDISAHDAVKSLSHLPRAEQDAQLADVIASAPKKGAPRRKGSTDGDGESQDKPKRGQTPIARLRKIYRDEEALQALTPQTRAVLDWVFAKMSNGDLAKAYPSLKTFANRR